MQFFSADVEGIKSELDKELDKKKQSLRQLKRIPGKASTKLNAFLADQQKKLEQFMEQQK